MGMFSSLFGSAGSDKADKLRQQAMDSFNAVKTPDLSALQVQLQKAVIAGQITPEQAEAQLLNSNAFNDIKSDPSLVGAQKQALQSLQDIGNGGGLTALDKAGIQDITDIQEQENKSAGDSVIANARARGMGNSNLSAVQRLISQQGSADRAAKRGLGIASDAEARALDALKSAGTQATGMRAEDQSEQQAKAVAQNDIDKFNAANRTDVSKFNTANDLSAQGANVGNAQHVEDMNTTNKNAEIVNNANANQTVFNDEMAKAAGKSGVLQNWANSAQQTQDKETGADLGLTSGLISAGASAVNPIAGAMSTGATSGVTDQASANYKPKIAPNQYASLGYSEGGEVKQTSESNPNTSSMEEEYDKFMQTFACGGTVNMSDGGRVTVKPGKKDESKPLPITAKGEHDWQLNDTNNEPIGDFQNYVDAAQFAEKVKSKQSPIQDFLNGGKVTGTAPVEGDSPKNDIVPARLSPGEVVVPRTDVAELEKKLGSPLEEALKRLKQNPQVGSVRG